MPYALLILLAYAACNAGLPGVKCDFSSFECEWKSGTVKEIGKLGITIVTEQKQPLALPFHIRLAHGELNRLGGDANAYLPVDVRIGDVVSVKTIVEKKQTFCVSIQICQRPGAKVPQSRRPDDWHPYHEVRQAINEYKDAKIPIPRFLQGIAKPWEYPSFNPDVPKSKRPKRFPHDNPFSYIEFALFMR